MPRSDPGAGGQTPPESGDEVDPDTFLRNLLRISPEDAAEVREDAAKAMAKQQDGVDEDHTPTD